MTLPVWLAMLELLFLVGHRIITQVVVIEFVQISLKPSQFFDGVCVLWGTYHCVPQDNKEISFKVPRCSFSQSHLQRDISCFYSAWSYGAELSFPVLCHM